LSVLNLYANGFFTTGSAGSATQYFPNPLGKGANNVWIQLTTGSTNIWGVDGDENTYVGFGIIEIEYLDSSGQVQQSKFGDITNLSDVDWQNLPTIYYQENMLSVTVAADSYNYDQICNTTLIEWG
jgi:hypothetical protein